MWRKVGQASYEACSGADRREAKEFVTSKKENLEKIAKFGRSKGWSQ